MTSQRNIINFLKQQLGTKPAILGLSGGVDSAVVAYLLAKAIGPKSIYAFNLPTKTNPTVDISDAKHVATVLGINFTMIPLDHIINAYRTAIHQPVTATMIGNITARVRMSLLYCQANRLNGLVVGTGNKSELLTGYFTKYGDGGVDVLPLGNVYKTEVWALAKRLHVPQQIINKAPSAGLWIGQTDAEELGLTYHELDPILKSISQGETLSRYNRSLVTRVNHLYQQSAHKRQLPPSA